MKTLSKFLFVALGMMALTACGSMGNVETAAPYEMERTAEHTQIVEQVAPPPVVEKMECPQVAPKQCPACANTNHDNLKARVAMLENELTTCREKLMRMQESTRDMMTK